MKQILAGAINYGRDGFPVSEVIAYYMASNSRSLQQYPNFKETYMPGGKSPKKGEILKNPYLANTLQKIAEGGRDAFYKGEIAQTIAAYMKKNGGYQAIMFDAKNKVYFGATESRKDGQASGY